MPPGFPPSGNTMLPQSQQRRKQGRLRGLGTTLCGVSRSKHCPNRRQNVLNYFLFLEISTAIAEIKAALEAEATPETPVPGLLEGSELFPLED